MTKARYNQDGWPLCTCKACGQANYVEPHGTTAWCRLCMKVTDHENIPYTQGDLYVKEKK